LRNDTRLAVDVWLPPGVAEGETVPAVLRPTTRWRDFEMRRRPMLDRPIGWTVDQWNAAGYALVIFDARGTGASFGQRADPWGIGSAGDGLGVVDWIVGQPWSSGRVAVWGEQDDAMLAEALLASGHEAIGAGILRFADWDLREHRLAPGGLWLTPVLEERDFRALALDAGDPCGFSPRDCNEVAPLFLGPRTVDADPEGVDRAAAIAEHETPRRSALLAGADAGSPAGADGETEADVSQSDPSGAEPDPIDELSPHRLAERLGRAGVPTQLWAGWWESASAEAALRRYAEVDAPQMLIIGVFGPGGATSAAPGRREPTAAVPDPAMQFAAMIAFVDRHLAGGQTGASQSGPGDERDGNLADDSTDLRTWVGGPPPDLAESWAGTGRFALEVLGEGWLEGAGPWPPELTADTELGLDAADGLRLLELEAGAQGRGDAAAANEGDDAVTHSPMDSERIGYTVDFGAGTGAFGRYLGRLEARLAWSDRATNDRRLLLFESAPLSERTILLGRPHLEVALAFDADGNAAASAAGEGDAAREAALHVYLEAVDPAGRVDLLSEGQLRMTGAAMQARLAPLQPLAVALPEGMRLRVALAGHDADAFGRVPAAGEVQWLVDATRSTLRLPVYGSSPWATQGMSGD
jgi:predicted acyl esterase